MASQSDIRSSRITYAIGTLDREQLFPDPFEQCRAWLEEAATHEEIREPNAMTVATVGKAGRPSARIVLLRHYDASGFVFFTNYESRKGHDLQENAQAALLFYWDRLERELRIEGHVERLSAADSDAYFRERPRGHRLSAWASPQSQPIAARSDLETALAAADLRFPDDVPRPPYWGGYRVVPRCIEFWQGRADRLHDRFVYERMDRTWNIRRLAP